MRPAVTRSLSKWNVAAAALLTVVLGYLVWHKSRPSQIEVASIEQSKIDSLPDGSYVILNKNSSISYARGLTGNDRKIHLKGEAFFEVAANKSKPFVVEVDNITVTVLGTSFNIKSNQRETEIIVESGAVRVSRNGQSVVLRAKEKLEVSADDTALQVSRSTDALYNYYRSREFVCDDTPLWKLVETLNEAYHAEIVIENENLKKLPLTATFHNESLDQILKIISETFGITVEQSSNKIILK